MMTRVRILDTGEIRDLCPECFEHLGDRYEVLCEMEWQECDECYRFLEDYEQEMAVVE